MIQFSEKISAKLFTFKVTQKGILVKIKTEVCITTGHLLSSTR